MDEDGGLIGLKQLTSQLKQDQKHIFNDLIKKVTMDTQGLMVINVIITYDAKHTVSCCTDVKN